jgi:N-carbamoyl-L-amino-acid hydrolase
MLAFLDGEQLLHDLDRLAEFGAEPGPGLYRIAYSLADQAGRQWIAEQCRALGMTVEIDAAGNTLARYEGTEPTLPPLALGSHTDTVPNGGRYDGALGVLAALACVRALRAANKRLRHPLLVINFAAEEATMSGGTLGSRALTGQLDSAVFDDPAWDGRPVREHWQQAGLDPAQVGQADRSTERFAAFLELHVEQGGLLEAARRSIGIVEGIVSIRRFRATFEGYANHAGTTPMVGRRDALVMAAPFILAVQEVALAHQIVGTVGTLLVEPGASNVIPGRVTLDVEIRGLQPAVLDQAAAELVKRAESYGGQLARMSIKPPAPSDPRLLAVLEDVCQQLELSYQRMPSGAGHDAMCMADLAPMAMLFVPSRGGVSHSPDEFTTPEDCINGVRVLLAALLTLDEQL